MKRLCTVLLAITVLAGLCLTAAAAEADLTVLVDGVPVSGPMPNP